MRMSRFLAPVALRIPISFVLSRTERRKRFASTNPATMSAIMPVTPRNATREPVRATRNLMISRGDTTVKSSGSPSGSL